MTRRFRVEICLVENVSEGGGGRASSGKNYTARPKIHIFNVRRGRADGRGVTRPFFMKNKKPAGKKVFENC